MNRSNALPGTYVAVAVTAAAPEIRRENRMVIELPVPLEEALG
jgi:hypothetical protein